MFISKLIFFNWIKNILTIDVFIETNFLIFLLQRHLHLSVINKLYCLMF